MDASSLIEVWYVRADAVGDLGLLRACEAILEPDEREQQQRMVFERHRHEYLLTRALCRLVLGRRLGRPPSELRFRRNTYGRPALDPPSTLRFNLTNTVDFVALAIADGREIGIDAEPIPRADAILQLAPTVFTARERSILDSLSREERRIAAVRLWTMKEAYIKARGMGMSLPVEEFELDPIAESPTLRFLAPLGDIASRWQFDVRTIGNHVVTTCIERNGALPPQMTVEHTDLAQLVNLHAGILQTR